MKSSRSEIPFSSAGAGWASALRRAGRSEITVDCYMSDLRIIAARLHDDRPDAFGRIGQQTLHDLVSHWRQSGAASATIGRRLSVMREFARYLNREMGIDCSSILAAEFPSQVRGQRVEPSAEDIGIVTQADENAKDWVLARDTAMFALMADCALTPAETSALDLRHVGTRCAQIVDSVFESRAILISKRASSALERYFALVPYELDTQGPVFVNERGRRLSCRTLQVRYRDRARSLGIPLGAGPSALRRSAGLGLAKDRSPPDVVARALGLSTISAFRFYPAGRNSR